MSAPYFTQKQPIKFKKGKSKGLTYRYYDPDRMVLGKRMEDQLRFAVCYWHSFCWTGTDPFGGLFGQIADHQAVVIGAGGF